MESDGGITECDRNGGDVLSSLRMHIHGDAFQAENAAMSQVGWLGHTGAVYGLHDPPRDSREPGGYSALYIQIGVYVTDPESGARWIED
jgi:hypothetical protein